MFVIADSATIALFGALGGAAIVGGLGFGGLVYVTHRQRRYSTRDELLATTAQFAAIVDEFENRFLRTVPQRIVHGSGRDVNTLLHELLVVRAKLEFIEPEKLTRARAELGDLIQGWSMSGGTTPPPGYIDARTQFIRTVRQVVGTDD